MMANSGNLSLHSVVTIAEAADWWGENQQALTRLLIRRSLDVEDPTTIIRKSKGTWITSVEVMITYKGVPKNDRPIYE